MTVQLRIRHTTGYRYADRAAVSFNEARMTPLSTSGQDVLRTRLEISPTPWTLEYRDYWGTAVTAFEVQDAHDALTVVATSTVESGGPLEAPEPGTWDDLAEVADRWCEFLTLSDWVAPPPDLVARLEPLRAAAATPADYAAAVGELLHDSIAYQPGSTEVTTVAAEAWAAGAGVCQDFAHLMLGALRWAGIPARYVSGYLHPQVEPVVGETVAGESHAWIDRWDGAWVPWDPTNAIVPGQRHVVVARGRDYADNPPLRGIVATDEGSEMFVTVEITRVR